MRIARRSTDQATPAPPKETAVPGRQIVLFHSALGLRPAVHDWADRLRGDGHAVLVPDLLEGAVFGDLDDAVRNRDRVGIPTLIGRAQAAVVDLRGPITFMGFSLGASAAEFLAAGHPAAAGAVLMHGALPLPMVFAERWRANVPVVVHAMADDPWVDPAAVVALGEAVRAAGAEFESFVYPGAGHLFADPGLPEFDAPAADLMFSRVREFLARPA